MASRRILFCSNLLNSPTASIQKKSFHWTKCLRAGTRLPFVVPQERDFIKEKFNSLMSWYEDFTGLKDVRMAQDKVLRAEERFVVAQDTRRDLSKQLSAVRETLKEIYAELDQTSRGDDRFVTLVTQENKILKDEKKLIEQFTQCEVDERERFSALSLAVKDSHEKERMQAERTKYWSIIGSVIGTILGIVGSSVNNRLKMHELRGLVKESAETYSANTKLSDSSIDLTGIKEALNSSKLYINKTSGDINHLLDQQKTQNVLLTVLCVTTAFTFIILARFGTS